MIEKEHVSKVIEALRAVVAPSCQQPIATGQHQVTIREKKPAAKGRLDEVHIDNIKEPLALLFPDKARPVLCGFLAEGKTQKACDAILATRYEGTGYLIVCEMKSGKIKGVSTQLKNTACFVDLLVSLARNHHDLDLSQWERRYVVLCARSLNKSATRPGQPKSGCSPFRPKEIFVKNQARLPIGALCLPAAKITAMP